jgi:hypothetical protein
VFLVRVHAVAVLAQPLGQDLNSARRSLLIEHREVSTGQVNRARKKCLGSCGGHQQSQAFAEFATRSVGSFWLWQRLAGITPFSADEPLRDG